MSERGTPEAYLDLLQKLLPPGVAMPRDEEAALTKVLKGLADELSRIDNRTADLLDEADPRTTNEMFGDWESTYGLPDKCMADNSTPQERRLALLAKVRARGGQSPAYFKRVAADLGYGDVVAIKEHRPFTCGKSKCGHTVGGTAIDRHNWKVEISGPRVTKFRCGVSRCGHKLGKISRAEDLECMLNRLKPAHTKLTIGYTGA